MSVKSILLVAALAATGLMPAVSAAVIAGGEPATVTSFVTISDCATHPSVVATVPGSSVAVTTVQTVATPATSPATGSTQETTASVSSETSSSPASLPALPTSATVVITSSVIANATATTNSTGTTVATAKTSAYTSNPPPAANGAAKHTEMQYLCMACSVAAMGAALLI